MVGATLKSMRTERGVTQLALSQCAGWTQPYTSMLEARTREISLPKLERYLQALEAASVRAAELRESNARAEQALLDRFMGDSTDSTHDASSTVPAQPRSAPSLLLNEPAGYAEAVARLTETCGKPKTLGEALLFSRVVDGAPLGGFIVTRAGWKRVDPKGVVLATGDNFGGLL